MKETAIALSYLFTPTVLKEMYESKSSNKLITVFQEFNIQNLLYENRTLKELFESAYKQLLKTYRNKYVFKNAIAKKILLGRHSINSSTLFTEFRVVYSTNSRLYLTKTDEVINEKSPHKSLDPTIELINDIKMKQFRCIIKRDYKLGDNLIRFIQRGTKLWKEHIAQNHNIGGFLKCVVAKIALWC